MPVGYCALRGLRKIEMRQFIFIAFSWLLVTTAQADGRESKALSPRVATTEAQICQAVADATNNGDLDLTKKNKDLQPLTSSNSIDETNRIFADKGINFQAPQYWRIDLNNDGALDNFVIDDEGTMHVNYAFFSSGKAGSTITQLDDTADWNYDLSLLNMGGKPFVLSSDGKKLGKLWHVSKDGVFQPICRFSLRNKPLTELVEGNKNPVCLKANTESIRHVRFNSIKNISLPDRGEIIGLAKTDIDNNGKPDNIARISYDGMCGGRGVHWTQVYVVNNSKTKISDTEANSILNSKLGGCNVDQNVFVYDGVAYVDEESDDGSREILLIKNGKGERICSFQGRFLFDVENIEPSPHRAQ